MDSKLRRYYMKKINGGRTLVARLLDFLIFRIVLMIALFIVLLQLSRSLTTALLVSLFLTLAVSLILYCIRQRRTERLIEKDLKKLKEKCLLETLTFLNPQEYAEYMNKLLGGLDNISLNDVGFSAEKNGVLVFVFHNHPTVMCEVGDVLHLLRTKNHKRMSFVSLSDFSEPMKALCQNATQSIKLISGADVLTLAANADMMPDEEVAQQKAEEEMSQTVITFSKLKESALSRKKVKAYMFCGIAAVVWPFVTGFRFYYPIIAAVCFALAIFTHRKNLQAPQTHDTGIS